MTYRERLQSIIAALDKCSQQITEIRDYTHIEKKKFLNDSKGAVFDALEDLEKLDNSLTHGEASTQY